MLAFLFPSHARADLCGISRCWRGIMDLRMFLKRIDQAGEVRVIEGANQDLEIGAITYLSAQKPSHPALLFDHISGCKPGFRLLTCSCSTEKRVNLLLDLPVEARGLDVVRNLRRKLSEPVGLLPPVEVKRGPILENTYFSDDVDLFMFPAPKWQALDGGRYLGTGDTVIMRDPDEGWVNIGTHRIQVHDRSTATIMFEPGKHGDIIRRKYWSRGLACPVAVTLGGDPLHVAVGGTRLPWGMPEYDYIGWWRKKPVEVVRGPVTGLPIPSGAEIALEGEILPPEADSRMEGPFLEWSGHYTPAKPEAAFKVKGVLHREDPIVLGELSFLGVGVPTGWSSFKIAAELWNHLEKLVPGINGVWVHLELGYNRAVAIAVEQKYGGHAKQVALAALGQMSHNRKFIIVVDDDVDPSNLGEVLFAVGMRSNPDSWDVITGCQTAILDPLLTTAKRESGDITHSAVMIVACKPFDWIKSFPPAMKRDLDVERKVKERWPDL